MNKLKFILVHTYIHIRIYRFGFSIPTTTTAQSSSIKKMNYENILVICILGGISYKEIAQIQLVLKNEYLYQNSMRNTTKNNDRNNNKNDIDIKLSRIVILSGKALCPEDILKIISE